MHYFLLPTFFLVMMIPWVSHGMEERGKPGEPSWAEIESELVQKGVATNTQSLIAAVRTDPRVEIRWAAIEILGLRGNTEARELFVELLGNDSDRLIQEAAALALARLGDNRGIKALRNIVDGPLRDTRQIFLATRLAELGDPSGYSLVEQATRSDDPLLRMYSVAGMAAFLSFTSKQDLALEALTELAHDLDLGVRREVIIQLSLAVYRGISVKFLEAIMKSMATNDQDPEIRESAEATLTLWGTLKQEER